MRSPSKSEAVAHPVESCSAAFRLKLRATLQIFILIVSLLFLTAQVAAAYVSPNVGHSPTSVKQDQQSSISAGPAQNGTDVRTLESGTVLERELSGGEAHFYIIPLAAGQYLRVIVDQRGIDVVVRMLAPDGKMLAEVDSPNGTSGPEPLKHVTEAVGSYRFEVNSLVKEAPPGRYQIRVGELRAATTQDKAHIAAERVHAEAEHLYKRGLPETRKRALQKYKEALALYVSARARQEEATTLKDIGVMYRLLGDNQLSLQYCNQALSIHRAIGNREGEASALYNLGLTYSYLGEDQKALDCYNLALPLRRVLGDRKGEAYLLISIGVIYRSFGENERALDVHRQALSIFKIINDLKGEALAVDNLGTDYDRLGDYHKALEYSERALALRRSLGSVGSEVGSLLSNIGVFHGRIGDHHKELEYYVQALPLRQRAGDRRGEAQTTQNIGGAYAELGDKRRAIDYYKQALAIRREIGSGAGQAESLRSIARTQYDEGDLTQARHHIEEAISIVEMLRGRVANKEFRTTYSSAVQGYYELHTDILMQLHKQQSGKGYDAVALQTSERARARGLLELLAEARADVRRGAHPELLEREGRMRERLNTAAERQTRLLSGKHTEEQAVETAKDLSALTSEYEQVQAQIRQSSPRYAALTQPRPLSLGEVQGMLDGDTLLLEYALGDERSYLWAVTATSLYSHELPKRAEIERQARLVYDLLTARNRFEKNETIGQRRARLQRAEAEYANEAAALSRMLLAPVAAQVEGRRLIVVADGALHYVPFAALPDPAGPGGGKWRPLIVGHEVTSLPSASVLATIRQEQTGRRPAARRAAVLADPVFKETDWRVRARIDGPLTTGAKPRGSEDEVVAATPVSLSAAALERSAGDVRLMGGAEFPRLAYTRELSRAVLARAPAGEVMQALDFKANRATATSRDLAEYRTVIFATHGLLNSKHPELSGLVLSLVDEEGRAQDGFLRLHDVYNMTLNADLVVLGACETGLGKEIKGEGLVGLTRGFMYAGARRVMASLWKVDEDATVELIRRMYVGMEREGRTPAAAVRAAQVSMLKERRFRSPYYWAGFVLQGEYR